MCLYPKLVKNPKYRPNKKNKGIVPPHCDDRVLMVPVGCKKCIECRKQKAREWNVRLLEEIRSNKNGVFVSLTLSNESIRELNEGIEGLEGYERDNEIAIKAVRRFLERWRKKYKKSIRHWLITELGHKGTENIHLHGIMFTDHKEDIDKIWNYGWVYKGYSCHEKTVNYTTKYVTKLDKDHKEYMPRILTSAGIGSNYINRPDAKRNEYNKHTNETNERYTDRKGFKKALPIYYRNKIYTEDEREILWLEKLDREERYVLGQKISIKEGYKEWDKAIEEAKRKNKRLGYGTDEIDWNRKEYENNRRNLLLKKRIEKNEKDTF